MRLPVTAGLRAEALGGLRRESISVSIFALAAITTAALALAARTTPAEDLVTTAIVVTLAGVVAIAADLRRMKVAWRNFRVNLTEDAIESRAVRNVVRRVALAEIQHVVEAVWPARGLVVRGPRGVAPVFVPAALEGYHDIRSHLAGIKRIERSRVPETMVRVWPFALVVICAALAFSIGSERVVPVVIASAFLAVVVLWSLSNVIRSKRLGLRAKALSTLMIVPLVWLVWRVVRVIT